MSFFSRLKWLFTGDGEAPASYKSAASHPKRNDSQLNHRGPGNHRPDRDRDRERSPRGDRDPRGNRQGRDSRGEGRDRNDRNGPRPGYNRDGGDRDRYAERDSRPHGGPNRGRSQGGEYGRRSNHEPAIPRQIDRPTGGPSSTMRPAQSSVAESLPTPAPRPAQQGPEKIGVVSNYLDDMRIASVKVEKGTMRSGDWIEIQGNISSLRQKVEALQLDNQPIQEAVEGQEVSIRVIRPVKSGDAVVRLRG